MKYLSVCSGIEAATVAWHPLGWRPVAFAEVDKFPSAVLAHHYPGVPNWGDMTRYQEWPDAAIDVLVGGTPCQSFSVAGLRRGLDDPRGNLMLTYLAIARQYRPAWLVWENVPGVLSSNRGRDFGAFLGALGQLRYGFAYRVLDAAHAGVPQRRRRVFVVGHLRNWRRAAAVLFERHSLSGDSPPSREAGQNITGSITACAGTNRKHGFGWGQQEWESGFAIPILESGAVAHTLRGEGFDASEDGTGRGTPLAPVVAGTLKANNGGGGWSNSVDHAAASAVRRLTPMECERLQGFPDNYTAIPWRGKPADQCSDGPRYKALGNSMAVPVMRWIGERIAMIASIVNHGEAAA